MTDVVIRCRTMYQLEQLVYNYLLLFHTSMRHFGVFLYEATFALLIFSQNTHSSRCIIMFFVLKSLLQSTFFFSFNSFLVINIQRCMYASFHIRIIIYRALIVLTMSTSDSLTTFRLTKGPEFFYSSYLTYPTFNDGTNVLNPDLKHLIYPDLC